MNKQADGSWVPFTKFVHKARWKTRRSNAKHEESARLFCRCIRFYAAFCFTPTESKKDDSLTLSEEDKKLLAKWSQMHGQKPVVPEIHAGLAMFPNASIACGPSPKATGRSELTQVNMARTDVNAHGCVLSGDSVVSSSINSAIEMASPSKSDKVPAQTVVSLDHSYHTRQKNTPPAEDASVDSWIDALVQKVAKSHVDDLTLSQTPKGSGGGYGLGTSATISNVEAGSQGNNR